MTHLKRAFFALHLLLCGSLLPVLAQETTPPLVMTPEPATGAVGCPGAADLTVALDERVVQLTALRKRLSTFVSGAQLTESAPAALFTVDLADPAAVARRVAELRSYAGARRRIVIATKRTYPLCRCRTGIRRHRAAAARATSRRESAAPEIPRIAV